MPFKKDGWLISSRMRTGECHMYILRILSSINLEEKRVFEGVESPIFILDPKSFAVFVSMPINPIYIQSCS